MSKAQRQSPREVAKLKARAGRGFARAARFVVATSKINAEPADFASRAVAQNPFILALWHGQFMLVGALKPQDLPVSAMVARHDDAQVLAAAMGAFDTDLIRGAGAGKRGRDRGGAAALREAIRALKAGRTVAMTADVPPGPARKAGLGIVTLARLSGRPIVPLAIATSRYRSFPTWSRMTINLPYSRLGLVLGEPIAVPPDADEAELERYRQAVEDALTAATARAYSLAGADPSRATPRQAAAVDVNADPAEPGLALRGYRSATTALQPIVPLILARRAKRNKEDRTRLGERYGRASVPRPSGPLTWVHAASVGEMNAVLPVIRAMKEDRERSNVLLTTGTVTSAALAEQISPGLLLHQYVPLDAPSYVRSFLDHWRPDLAILTESEIWPNLVLETYARGVPLVLANARMSGDSFRRWRGKPSMAQPLFSRFDLVLAQNEKLGQRFAQLGARRVEAVGNLKLDSPALPVDVAQRNELALRLAGRPVWLAASTHPGEDEPVLDAHAQLSREMPGLMTILVPRHADRGAEIASKVSQRDLTFARRSQGQMPERGTEVYVGDTMGELGLFYSLSRVAFIGGSLVPKGGQNPVEAVKLSSGVLMGTHWENFRDVYRALLRRQAAREIRSSSELANTVGQLLNDGDQLAQMVQRAGMVVAGMTGALQRTMAALDRYLPSDPPELRHAG